MSASAASGTWVGMLVGSQRAMPHARSVYEAVVRETEMALAGGVAVLVAPQHLLSEPYLTLQPWALLAALRATLPGEPVTVASVIAGLSSPLQLLRELATVQAFGTGPVGMALAAGYRPQEFLQAGRDFADRFKARQEAVAELVTAAQVPSEWLWYSAGNEHAVRSAVLAGARWYTPPTLPDQEIKRLLTLLGGSCVVRRDVFTAETDVEVDRGLKAYVAPKYTAYRSWGYGEGSSIVVGTPDRVTELLLKLLEETRPEGLVVRLCWPDMDVDEALRHLALFVSSVLPALKKPVRSMTGEGVG